MAYVITEPCIGTKDKSCVDVCPVDCIHGKDEDEMLYIDPEVCIDCGACVSACPTCPRSGRTTPRSTPNTLRSDRRDFGKLVQRIFCVGSLGHRRVDLFSLLHCQTQREQREGACAVGTDLCMRRMWTTRCARAYGAAESRGRSRLVLHQLRKLPSRDALNQSSKTYCSWPYFAKTS